MDSTTFSGSDPAALAAACAIAPDALTATILAKHAAGDKLSPQECGKLGAWKRKANNDPVGRGHRKGLSGAQSLGLAPAAWGQTLAGLAPDQISDDGLPVPAADPLLVSRTVGVVLARMDQATQAWINRSVKAVGRDEILAREYCAQAALPPESAGVIRDLAPIMADSVGLNARTFPITALVVTVLGWLVGVGLIVFNLIGLCT